ncbi:MAG: proline dehydrogenase [Candidatus Marinimicrobia bacterium]|nr:proline dehydrogenase [Candidatus Neomarinimicrobiota bacterium]MBT3632245.1 proline dehydrogenase [Candidatus Neomarinimicrobiota bacterium]MBT3825947.1 proline dehydrogenase [Candidatus Neomarinimicrobiota bacterium]MBT4129647.1 proline dehydrogenase [Candidatus Neomarinimicrobiota bacterium]MBT4294458.1 proline dehydrogenase [Candidatus Neomarinimicrobiota bacterium]
MFNKLIVALMPLAPRFIVKMISKRYIAGEDTPSAMATCKQLNAQGFLTTVDILGESVTTNDQAREACDSYLDLITEVSKSNIEKNISLKPTAMGLGLSYDMAFEFIAAIVQKAHESGVFIRIDMEDSPYTDKTLEMYERLRDQYPQLGTVIQAYMHRSLDDVKKIATSSGNLRICKGIYKESPQIAYQDADEVRHNYIKLVREMLEQGAYVGIATHDPFLIDESLRLIDELNISADKYEFQALLGVPIVKRLEALISMGHRVRIYVPFGSEWYAYSSRRLKENPDVAGYVLKNLFVKN